MKAKFFSRLCDVIFQVRLQGKFGSEGVKQKAFPQSHLPNTAFLDITIFFLVVQKLMQYRDAWRVTPKQMPSTFVVSHVETSQRINAQTP